MTDTYEIGLSDADGMVVISPQMALTVIKKAQSCKKEKLAIPAKQILPQGYVLYLSRVLFANGKADGTLKATYQVIAEQLGMLYIGQEKCFKEVRAERRGGSVWFVLRGGLVGRCAND